MPADTLACTPLVRIQLVTPLPCGIHSCQQLAQVALAEPDLTFPGLWTILPLCPLCLAGQMAGLLPPDASNASDASDPCVAQLENVMPRTQSKRRKRHNTAEQAKQTNTR